MVSKQISLSPRHLKLVWNPSGIHPTGPQKREETKVCIPVLVRVGSIKGETVRQTIYSMFVV